MNEKEYILNWLDERKHLIKLFNFKTQQPGNLGSNRSLYNEVIKDFKLPIGRKEFFGLVKLYLEKGDISSAFCVVCNKMCKCKSDYTFHDACSKECGSKIRAKKNSLRYQSKTEEEKQLIKEKRKATNLARYGVDTNLQTQEVKQSRINKYGSNTPFSDPAVRQRLLENNKLKHNGLGNSFQWKESIEKAKKN